MLWTAPPVPHQQGSGQYLSPPVGLGATERDRARPSATERRERRERVSVSKSQLQFDSS
jgi:hypothetical protein